MKRIENLVLLSLLGCFLFISQSCSDESVLTGTPDSVVDSQNPQQAIEENSPAPKDYVFGEEREDPYEIGNMQKALGIMVEMYPDQLSSLTGYQLSPTHKYVKFIANGQEDLQLLEALKYPPTDFPIHLEVSEIGNTIGQASSGDKLIRYGLIEVGETTSVDYEEIKRLFLPNKSDLGVRAMQHTEKLTNIEGGKFGEELGKISKYLVNHNHNKGVDFEDMASAMGCYTAKKAEGRLRAYDDRYVGRWERGADRTVPLAGKKILIYDDSYTWEQVTTGADGSWSANHVNFSTGGWVSMEIRWGGSGFDIADNNLQLANYNRFKSFPANPCTAPLNFSFDITFAWGVQAFYAAIWKAAHRFYTQSMATKPKSSRVNTTDILIQAFSAPEDNLTSAVQYVGLTKSPTIKAYQFFSYYSDVPQWTERYEFRRVYRQTYENIALGAYEMNRGWPNNTQIDERRLANNYAWALRWYEVDNEYPAHRNFQFYIDRGRENSKQAFEDVLDNFQQHTQVYTKYYPTYTELSDECDFVYDVVNNSGITMQDLTNEVFNVNPLPASKDDVLRSLENKATNPGLKNALKKLRISYACYCSQEHPNCGGLVVPPVGY